MDTGGYVIDHRGDVINPTDYVIDTTGYVIYPRDYVTAHRVN